MQLVILAPHPDDELIGCLEQIELARTRGWLPSVVLLPGITTKPGWYVDKNDASEPTNTNPLGLIPVVGDACAAYLEGNEGQWEQIQYLFPDPAFETHPEHRRWGAVGERLLRTGASVWFYSVNMQAPYVREVRRPHWKRTCLQWYYPSASSLWQYDHRYFLFEGQCLWLLPQWKEENE